MGNTPNNPDAPITAGVLNTEFGKFEERLDRKLDKRFSEHTKATEQLLSEHTKATEQLLSEHTKSTEQLLADQANVILEAVEERMDKKLDEKFDPVITKLDAVLKKFEDHRDEDIAGAEQLRRHDKKLVKLEARVGALEKAATRHK
jgi:hypothetical protein